MQVKGSFQALNSKIIWENIPSLKIEKYLWANNYYRPLVFVKLSYTDKCLLCYFKVFEDEITAIYTQINDLVHKDSCVEFFVNLFPSKTDAYFNFEVNPLGTMHIGFGALGRRIKLSVEDIQLIEKFSSVKTPVKGKYESDNWEVIYKIPFTLFEKYYSLKFNGDNAEGNFYKCGDETKFMHYGVWNNVISEKPNFHLPKYFGEIIFEK